MEVNEHNIDELIAEFLSQGLTGERMDALESWINQSEQNRRYFMQREEVWFSSMSGHEQAQYDEAKAFGLFRQRVRAAEARSKRKMLLKLFGRCAAAVVLLCAVAYFSYRRGGHDLKNSLAQIAVEAPEGSQTRMRLPDSTLVVLNAGSRLVYGQDFGVDDREVRLEGEGYFEVTRDVSKPFRVMSENVALTVLGTKFDFRDYAEEGTVIVSLREGKVVLDNRRHEDLSLTLHPNERMVLDKSEGRMKLEHMRSTDYLKWVDGKLVFDGMPLEEVVKILERSYGVPILIRNDRLKRLPLHGCFNRKEQGLKEILEVIQSTGKIEYGMIKNKVIIY